MQLKAKRLVVPAHTGNQPIREVLIPRQGLSVHLKGDGLIKIFKIAAPNGRLEFWATSDLTMTVSAVPTKPRDCGASKHRLYRKYSGKLPKVG